MIDLVFSSDNMYLGMGYILDGFLRIDPGDQFEYEVSVYEIDRVLNLSDPCMPESYYRLH